MSNNNNNNNKDDKDDKDKNNKITLIPREINDLSLNKFLYRLLIIQKQNF